MRLHLADAATGDALREEPKLRFGAYPTAITKAPSGRWFATEDAFMKMAMLLASALILSTGAAFAQSEKSDQDKPAASGQSHQTDKMSPGTTGAMQNSSSGVATSPQDVQKQGGVGVGAQGDSGKAGKEMGGGNNEKPK